MFHSDIYHLICNKMQRTLIITMKINTFMFCYHLSDKSIQSNSFKFCLRYIFIAKCLY